MLVEQYNNLIKENAKLHQPEIDQTLEKYFKTKTLQRLLGRGMFCGMDYVSIKELVPVEMYTRFDHSKNVAYAAVSLSNSLEEVLTGAFHDVGTLSFAHVNSFKKGNALKQDADELNIKSILEKDEELLTYLHEDKIALADVVNPEKYPLIDKEVPSLCLDRLDGILTTCLIWAHSHDFETIKELYLMTGYVENLNGMALDSFSKRFENFTGEMCIEDGGLDIEDFFAAINVYSEKLLSKESRYMMEVLGLALNYYEDIGLITEKDLFDLSEQEIIAKIMNSKYNTVWKDITTFDKVKYASSEDNGLIVTSRPKIRQANPLCFAHMALQEVDAISGDFYHELNNLYSALAVIDKPITGNLSESTAKILSKYQKK